MFQAQSTPQGFVMLLLVIAVKMTKMKHNTMMLEIASGRSSIDADDDDDGNHPEKCT